MSEPDYLPLTPGRRLEYAVARAGETRRLFVENRTRAGGGVTVRRTWRDEAGREESEESRGEVRGDGTYLDGALVLPRPARAGASWSQPPRRYRVESLDAAAATPAGPFSGCLRVTYLIAEGDGGAGERLYAPGVGLVFERCADEADPFEVRLVRADAAVAR